MSESSLQGLITPPPGRRSRRQQREDASRRKRRRRRSLLSVLVTIGVVAVAVLGAWLGVRPVIQSLREPDDWPGPGHDSVQVRIEPGASGKQIALTLHGDGVVKTSGAFLDVLSEDPRAARIQPGTYKLRREMSAAGALASLLDPESRLTSRITVREGLRVTQVVDLLADQGGFSRRELDAAVKDPSRIGLPRSAGGDPEGYLAPATYEFEPSTSATDALRAMVDHGREVLDDADVPAGKERQVLVAASIVQAEGGKGKDFPKVARVIANRLRDGEKLQMDSTVSYGTNTFRLFTTAEQRADDNPYNTYLHQGLPAGPICNPGAEAIKAVLHPAKGDWKFFTLVNLDTGETRFSTTKAGHDAAVAELRAWIQEHDR